MSAGSSPSIHTRLIHLVLSCVIPAVLLAALLIVYEYQRAREQLVRDSLATARAMVSVVDAELATITSSLESLATSPHLTTNDLAAFDAQARQVLRHQAADNIVLSDLAGKQYVNTLRPYGENLPQRSGAVRLQKMARTGQPMVTDLFIGPLLRKPLIVIGVPVYRNGKYIYSLSAGLFANSFSKILKRQELPAEWLGVILDSSGTVVARTRNNERFIGQKGPPDALSRIAESREASFEVVSLEGEPMVTVFSRSVTTNWAVVIAIPKKSLTRGLQHTFAWLILAAGVLLASSLCISWIIGGRIVRSVSGLRGPALALGTGKAVVLPPLHLKEADEVGKLLVKASEMLLQAKHQASHDVLTGLPNRALFNEMLDKQLAICQRNKNALSILYIDLDGFKDINDRYGHAVGDKLLHAAAQRLNSGLRRGDVPARLGGDEFAAVLVDAEAEAAAAVASKLVDRLSDAYVVEDLVIKITASIGVASFPASGTTSKALLHSADNEMYRAKARRKRHITGTGDMPVS